MDMNLQIIQNPKFGKVRFQMIDGDPWFCGKDVCDILGYSNPWKAMQDHVSEDDLTKCEVIDSKGRYQETNFINESGLYSLIFGSTLPIAKEFKRWVTSEVLPSIRKNGFYMTPEKAERIARDPDFWIEVFKELKEKNKKIVEQAELIVKQRDKNILLYNDNCQLVKDNCQLIEDNCQLTEDNQKLRPKAEFADAVASATDLITVNELSKIAQQNGIPYGEKTLYKKMREDGLLCTSKNMWNLPTQRASDLGLFKVTYMNQQKADGTVAVRNTTKVTRYGQQWIIRHYREKINRLLAEAREEGVY